MSHSSLALAMMAALKQLRPDCYWNLAQEDFDDREKIEAVHEAYKHRNWPTPANLVRFVGIVPATIKGEKTIEVIATAGRRLSGWGRVRVQVPEHQVLQRQLNAIMREQ